MTKISAVIPDDLNAALKERARAEDRSVGAVIRRAIAQHIESRTATSATVEPTRGPRRDGQ